MINLDTAWQIKEVLRKGHEESRETRRELGNITIRDVTGGGDTGDFSFYTADLKANLPEVDAPALGYTTSTEHYFFRSGDAATGEWVALDYFELVE